MSPKKFVLITLTLIMLISLSSLNFQKMNVEASPTAHIYIEPAAVIQAPGQNFTVTVKIKDSPRIYSWYVNLTWNPTIIRLVGIAEGTFLNQHWSRKTDFIYTKMTIELGYVRFGCSLKGEPSSAQPSGDGILATLTFTVLEEGGTPIHFVWVKLYNYQLEQQPYTTTDGYFKYPIFAISIQPQYVYQLLAPGEKFNVSIATFVRNLYSWNATISWDPTIINATRIFEGPFLNMNETLQTQFKYQIFKNSTTISGAILEGGQPVSSTMENLGILATIEFEVKGVGASDITFKEFYFLDANGLILLAPMLGISYNGKFCNTWSDIKVEVNISDKTIKPGQVVKITVLVKNEGLIPETFEVRVYVGPLGLTLLGSRELSLGPGENETLTFEWDSSKCEGGGDYKVRVLVDPSINEVDVENNLAFAEFSIESSLKIPIELIIAAVVVVAIIVLASIFIFKMRRKRKF